MKTFVIATIACLICVSTMSYAQVICQETIENSTTPSSRELGEIIYETSGEGSSPVGAFDVNILAEDISLLTSGISMISGVELSLAIDGDQEVKLWFFDEFNAPAIHVEDLGILNTDGVSTMFQFELGAPIAVPQNLYIGVSIQGNDATDWIKTASEVVIGAGTPGTYFYGSIAGGILTNEWTITVEHFDMKVFAEGVVATENVNWGEIKSFFF